MKKILFVANVHQHFLDCHVPYIKWLSGQGHEVHVAAGEEKPVPFAAKQFTISIQRSPFSYKNIRAYFELKKIIRENRYNLIHCHTPMGGVVARLAGRSFRKKGTLKVLYTAHGFYFYHGAPKIYWLLYFPVERMLARFTDGLITINNEDFNNARQYHFQSRELFKINGIGINSHKFKLLTNKERSCLRKELGYNDKQFILIYAAEFIPRKNHRFIIDAIPLLNKEIRELRIIFAGAGAIMNETIEYAKQKGLSEYVDFVGFRHDIEKLMALSDTGISASRLEGLPMNVAEEMFCGIPVVVSDIRGHRDLVENVSNGFLYPQNDHSRFAEHIIYLYNNPETRKKMGETAFQNVQKFSIENSMNSMTEIYNRFL